MKKRRKAQKTYPLPKWTDPPGCEGIFVKSRKSENGEIGLHVVIYQSSDPDFVLITVRGLFNCSLYESQEPKNWQRADLYMTITKAEIPSWLRLQTESLRRIFARTNNHGDRIAKFYANWIEEIIPICEEKIINLEKS